MPRFSGLPVATEQTVDHPKSRAPRKLPVISRGNPAVLAYRQIEADIASNPVVSVGFLAAILLFFMKFAVIPELFNTITGANLKLLYFAAPFAYLAVPFSPGFQSALREKAVVLFICFFGWMALATPFSFWVGDSVTRTKDYLIHALPLVLVGSCLFLTWKHLQRAFLALAVAGVVVLISVRFFGVAGDDRLSLASSGTIGNSNDLAAHLLLLSPFLVLIVMDRNRSWLLKLVAIPFLGYSAVAILRTGSRGALIALGFVALLVLWRSPISVRLGFLGAAVLLALVLPSVLPESTMTRLGTLFGEHHAEAEESGDAREYLFMRSLQFTMEKPVFGVGPGQFTNYEGYRSLSEGVRGNWHATHCFWTQVSSECGIPALLFVLGSLWCAIVPVFRLYSAAIRQEHRQVANTCLCFLIACVGYFTAVTFLAQAYYFQTAAIVGLAVALKNAGASELANQAPSLAIS